MKKWKVLTGMALTAVVMMTGMTANKVSAAETEDETQEEANSDMLVAYFSWSGNTEEIAKMIAADTGADLFEIVPEEAYTDDYDAVVEQAQEEQNEDVRPAIKDEVENWDDYQTVFIGYPNWWSDVPMIINTFLESYDFEGKTVVPFCTHGGGGFGTSLSSIEEGAEGATILDGFQVSGSKAAQSEAAVQEWLDTLELQ